MLRLCKISETQKDFGKSFYRVWADVFYYYMTIFVFFWAKRLRTSIPRLCQILRLYLRAVHCLQIVRDSLSMVIKAHTFIVVQQATDLLKSVIPEKFQVRFCSPKTIKNMCSILGGERNSNKRRKSRSPATAGYQIKVAS